MKNVKFRGLKPIYEEYGFGDLKHGQICKVDAIDTIERDKIQRYVSAYGKYHGKKFQTTVQDGILYIKRIG